MYETEKAAIAGDNNIRIPQALAATDAQTRLEAYIRQTEVALEDTMQQLHRVESVLERLRGDAPARPVPDIPQREAGSLGYLADVSARFNFANSELSQRLTELEELV